MAREVIVTAEKVKNRKRLWRIVKLSLCLLLLFMIVVYFILQIIYNEGRFTILLDSNKTLESGIAIYDNLDDPRPRRRLEADAVPFMDNISWKWLPEDIDTRSDGSHNGENFLAYSFYIENQGNSILHYWYELNLDLVTRNVDEAIRVMIFQNGERKIYAKPNSLSGEPEHIGTRDTELTIPFLADRGNTIILEQRRDFNPGDRDRYTIVIWIEGDDPDCLDPLIGGVLRMYMKITEEHIQRRGGE